MGRVMIVSVFAVLLLAPPAQAQVTYPGSVWQSLGTLSPAEPHNASILAHLEQGIAWRGAEFFVLSTLGMDERGYDWNNRLQGGAGLRLTQTTPAGAVRVSAAWVRERRWVTERPHDGLQILVESYHSWGQRRSVPPISPVLIYVPQGGTR